MLIELFLGYLSTLAISLSLNIYEEMKLRKELCDNNYRFKMDYNSNEYFNEFINSTNRFIPVVNVCEALIDLKEYNDNKNYYLNNLLFMNVLEKMSIYEEA